MISLYIKNINHSPYRFFSTMTTKLMRMRALLEEHKLAAYVIPHDDAHLVKYVFHLRASTHQRLTAESSIFLDLQGVLA